VKVCLYLVMAPACSWRTTGYSATDATNGDVCQGMWRTALLTTPSGELDTCCYHHQ
jgi:hypothetical protein